MARGADLTSKEWRDIVFDGKNKEYGAYDLRKKSQKRHVLAIIFTIIFLVAVAIGVILYNIYDEYQREKAEALALALAEAERMSQVDLGEAEEEVPEEEPEEQKYEEPKVEVPEEVLATVQVTQIAIVDADKVKNEVMTMDEQKEDNTARGTVNQAGQDDITAFKAVEEKVVVKEPEPEPIAPKPEPEKVFKVVEQQASFPGGPSAMMKWLSNNIRYPETAQQNNIEGRVIVQFIVEKDGSIGHAEVVKGVDRDLDREALRVVNRMPKWTPGKNNGHSVRSYFTLPVTFKLQQM